MGTRWTQLGPPSSNGASLPSSSLRLPHWTSAHASHGPHWPGVVARGAQPTNLGVIRGLLLEMDNVLYDATLWRRWLWHLVGRMGVHEEYDVFSWTWESRYLVDVHRGRR